MLRSAAAERNKDPIAEVLKKYLGDGKKVLEIASGTGVHAIHLAACFPNVTFQPSENDPRMLHSIVNYIDTLQPPNVRVPLFLDATKPFEQWALPEDFAPQTVDVMLNINMIHICPKRAVKGLFEASNALLKKDDGLLITYGPYSIDGKLTPQSNVDFDHSLKNQDPEWGIKDVRDLEKLAERANLRLAVQHDMPANNKILVFSR